MAIPSEMNALLVTNDGYAATPSGTLLEAMEPYVEAGRIARAAAEGRRRC